MAKLEELDVYPRLPIDVVGSEGNELICRDGRRVLDLYGGHCVNSLGGSHPGLGAAIASQWNEVSFLSNLFHHEPRAEFLEAFGALLPAGDWRVFFSNSGAEANENALKMALAASGRPKVVAFEGAFHGRTAAAAAISDVKREAFTRAPFDVIRLPWGDLDAARAAIVDDVAAVVAEPIQSMAGVRMPPPGFLEGLSRLTTDAGAALIFDEVQTGSGRTGEAWAATTLGVTPDILTTAKGAAGGLPIGISVVSAPWAAAVPKGILGSTFGGGPTVLAAATYVARAVADPVFRARVVESGAALVAAARLGPVREVRGAGLLLGLVLDRGLVASEVRDSLLSEGVLVATSNDPEVLRLFPPLTFTPADAQRFGDAIARVATAV